MNFEDAIAAHAKWKVRLTAYLANPDGSLNPEEIGRDDRCEFGKWLHGEAHLQADPHDLRELKATHAEFHRATANIVRKIHAGAVPDVNAFAGFSSDYGKLSTKIVIMLKKMAGKVGLAA